MANVQRFQSGKQLLRVFTDNPALPDFIPSLEPMDLGKLITEVGIEDSALLIEHTTPGQLAAVVDDTVWRSVAPGMPERFEPEEFLRWLEILLEISDEFAAERLAAMDEDLLATAMGYYLYVQDLDLKVVDESETRQSGQLEALSGAEAELVGNYGSFEVKPRYGDEWDVIQATLFALRMNEPELLQAVLSRCAIAMSLLASNRDVAQAEMDAAQTHRQRREQQGFITPERARLFLESARDATPEELLSATAYDLDTMDYFNRTARAAATQQTSTEDDPGPERHPEVDSAHFREMEQALNSIDLSQTTRGLLAYDGTKRRTPLEEKLLEMADRYPERVADRLAESMYLSNLLIAGASLDRLPFQANDAAEAVMATCNLAFEFHPTTGIDKEPGLVRLFCVGWHLVQQLQLKTLDAINNALASAPTDDQLSARTWVLSEVKSELGKPSTRADVELREFTKVHHMVHMLSLTLGSETCAVLRALLDEVPCMTHEQQRRGQNKRRFITTTDDLADIGRLFNALERSIRTNA